jgi:zinc D-Ala-D-Ala carboxypeptidase
MRHPAARSGVVVTLPLMVVITLVFPLIVTLVVTVGLTATLSVRSGYATVQGDGAATESDGILPDGVTVFDDRYPGVFRLDPELLNALRDAGTAAMRVGVKLYVNSGWRSTAYQNQLLREAVATYGSEREAARWVATAETSAHVNGKAVDIKGAEAMTWLSRHGAVYGLCQIYRNEPWHYEQRATALGCPVMYDDPAHDPRVQPS